MAAGRRLTCRRSVGFTPATVKPTDSEKNAMPNDIANLGCRTVAQIGCIWLDIQASIPARTRSSHETFGCDPGAWIRKRWVSTPDVDARIFMTRPAGGSTSVRPFSQLRPASASANSGPHAEHTREWAWKRSSLAPVRTPSSASVSRASNSLHCNPFFVWSGITSPAYRYVVTGALVPPVHDLFDFSQFPPAPSKRSRFRGNPYPVSPLESQPHAAPAKASPALHARFPQPPGCVRAHPEAHFGPEFAH